jgi:hypothetical protein
VISDALRNYELALADESRDLADAAHQLAKALVWVTGDTKLWGFPSRGLADIAHWMVTKNEREMRRQELLDALARRTYDSLNDLRETFRHEGAT